MDLWENGGGGVIVDSVEVGGVLGKDVGGLGGYSGLNLGSGKVGTLLNSVDAHIEWGFDLPCLVYHIIYT